jgi:hypothetical protein
MTDLATMFWNLGRWLEAQKTIVRVMETGQRVPVEEHPDTLINMNNLSFTIRRKAETWGSANSWQSVCNFKSES